MKLDDIYGIDNHFRTCAYVIDTLIEPLHTYANYMAFCFVYCTLTILHTLERKVNQKTSILEIYIEIRSDISLRTVINSLRSPDLTIEGLQPEPDVSSDDARAFILTRKSTRRRDSLHLMEQMQDTEFGLVLNWAFIAHGGRRTPIIIVERLLNTSELREIQVV